MEDIYLRFQTCPLSCLSTPMIRLGSASNTIIIPRTRLVPLSYPGGCLWRPHTTKRDDTWETVIGLEIHAQLKTGRKLFSSEDGVVPLSPPCPDQ